MLSTSCFETVSHLCQSFHLARDHLSLSSQSPHRPRKRRTINPNPIRANIISRKKNHNRTTWLFRTNIRLYPLDTKSSILEARLLNAAISTRRRPKNEILCQNGKKSRSCPDSLSQVLVQCAWKHKFWSMNVQPGLSEILRSVKIWSDNRYTTQPFDWLLTGLIRIYCFVLVGSLTPSGDLDRLMSLSNCSNCWMPANVWFCLTRIRFSWFCRINIKGLVENIRSSGLPRLDMHAALHGRFAFGMDGWDGLFQLS